MSEIIASIVVGVLSLIGVIVTNISSNHSVENKIVTSQEVMKTEIATLRREVEKHNSFATRVPVLEEKVSDIERRVQNLEHDKS